MAKLEDARHEAFARHLARGRSQTEAYRLAGFGGDDSNASRLATGNDRITRRVEELKSAAARRAEVSVAYVLTKTKQLLERCMQAEPVMMRNDEGEMVPSGEYKFDASGAAKALDLIAKHIGMFNHIQKHEHKITEARETIATMPQNDYDVMREIMMRNREARKAD